MTGAGDLKGAFARLRSFARTPDAWSRCSELANGQLSRL